jgi:hypothetical protein
MKTKLIETTSPTYVRRLVRELNVRMANGDPVYTWSPRQNHRIASARAARNTVIVLIHGRLHNAQTTSFYDANGQQICASRAN